MGMDLVAVRPWKCAPRDANGLLLEPHFNWLGWRRFIDKLDSWGIDTSEFSGFNNGDLISAKTCKAVAKALTEHWDETKDNDGWLEGYAEMFRTSGGYRQW